MRIPQGEKQNLPRVGVQKASYRKEMALIDCFSKCLLLSLEKHSVPPLCLVTQPALPAEIVGDTFRKKSQGKNTTIHVLPPFHVLRLAEVTQNRDRLG